MAASITKFDDAFEYKVIVDTSCSNTAVENVTAEPGYIYSISLDNAGSQSDSYFKFFDAASVTMGVTVADMVLKVKANSTYVFEIPKGLHFTYLSFACTANPNPADNTAVGGGVVVRISVGKTKYTAQNISQNIESGESSSPDLGAYE